MSDVQAIKDKIDVADLIGEYVQLKPSGVNKKGLCPFHHEKSPSFMVNSERQSWHCFGCAKGGDIFSFVQEIEGMEFVEALKYLANRAGIQLDNNFRSEINSSQKNRLKEINKEAARFFYNFLIKMPGAKPALDYLVKRGLKEETIDEWQIGFIPDQWDLLTQYLFKKGFSIDDLVASGLTIKCEDANVQTGRGFWDRFRGRIMFPIWDIHGEVVGFTGRILVEKPDSAKATPGKENFTPGKYINTPQTVIYDKSRVIFGLNKAKQEIKTKDLVVMVEGQMDVIACHQAGMKNVAASSGTALTEQQIKLLQRYSANLNLSFDADEAGQNAAKRGIDVALSMGMNVKVIKIPEGAGKDPDECLKKNSAIWFQAVNNAQAVMEWFLEKVLYGQDLSNPRLKQIVANKFLSQIVLIPYAVERDHWLKQLSERLGVEVSVLREDQEKIKTKIKIKAEVVGSNSEEKKVSILSPIASEETRLDILIENLVAGLLRYPKLYSELADKMPEAALFAWRYGGLYNELKKQYNGGNLEANKLRDLSILENQENIVDVLMLKGEWEFSVISELEVKKELENLCERIKEEWVRNRRHEMQTEIEKAEKAGDTFKVKSLLGEFEELNIK